MILIPPVAPPPVHHLPSPPGISHGAGLLRLANGDLIACWYSGASEAGRGAVILCARSGDGGDSWSPPSRVSTPHEQALSAAAPAKSVGNVVLASDAGGRVVMISGEIQSRRVLGVETCRNWRCGRIDFRISTDRGLTWSVPTRLDDRPGALPRSRPSPPGGGAVSLPVYQEAGRASVLSLDLAALRPGATPSIHATPIPARTALIEPSLTPAAAADAANGPQPARAYLRDPHRRFVYVSTYDPAAGAWSQATPTDLENPASAVEAFRDLRGRTVLAHNPGRTDRRTLSLAVSVDGLHFPADCVLVPAGAAGGVAYPAVAELGPGEWGLVLSTEDKRRIGFMRIDQRWIDACAAPGLSQTP